MIWVCIILASLACVFLGMGIGHAVIQFTELKATVETQAKYLDDMIFKYVKTMNLRIDQLIVSLPKKRTKEEPPEANT